MKNNKGITLIALIITIIVMIILVAVTINMAVNGGLFGYAGNAARETEEAKQKESDWLNVEGLTTDQMIAKYTTDREKDLEILRNAYVHNDQEAINTIIADEAPPNELQESDNSILIEYHGYYYKAIGNWDDGFSDIQEYEPTLLEIVLGMGTSDGYNYNAGEYEYTAFYSYNNKDYLVEYRYDSNIGDMVPMAIEETSNTVRIRNSNSNIAFSIQNNTTTWYEWASDPNNNFDIDWGLIDGTLKEIIISQNNETNNIIFYNTSHCLVKETELDGFPDFNYQKTDDYIIPGMAYITDVR